MFASVTDNISLRARLEYNPGYYTQNDSDLKEGIAIIRAELVAIIDCRPGNRRADIFTNVRENPRVGLTFSYLEKARHYASAGAPQSFGTRICVDRWPPAARPLTSHQRSVDVEEVFFHCSKCIVRSSLWIPQAWPSLDGLPSLAQTMVDAAALPMPVEALEEIIKQDESERLYWV
jgi:uncharacterized protein